MEICYLTKLPKESVRALAGFDAAGKHFFLPKAECSVPRELSCLVFPAIEDTESLFESGVAQDIAGQGFLRLLKWLRDVLIQDSILVRRELPDHPIWSHTIFKSAVYKVYADGVENYMQSNEGSSAQMSVKAAVPILSNIVESGLASVSQRLFAIESSLSTVREDVRSIKKGHFTVAFEPAPSQLNDISDSGSPATYRLSRGLRSVPDVWAEYSSGWQGGPSVMDLEKKHGASWRADEAERKYYSRRKVFYDAIQFLATERRLPPTTIAEMFESKRPGAKATLDKSMKDIKKRGAAAVLD